VSSMWMDLILDGRAKTGLDDERLRYATVKVP
jgi:hypothetical protein